MDRKPRKQGVIQCHSRHTLQVEWKNILGNTNNIDEQLPEKWKNPIFIQAKQHSDVIICMAAKVGKQ